MFTISLEKQNAFTMIAGNLYYELESDGTKIEKVTVPSNTIQEVALTIRSLNGLESIYQLYTSLLPEGISVVRRMKKSARRIVPKKLRL